jgi:hypothetical protein
VRRIAYQLLGAAVWNGLRAYLRQRYGDTPRKVAFGGLLVGAAAVLLLASRRATSE